MEPLPIEDSQAIYDLLTQFFAKMLEEGNV